MNDDNNQSAEDFLKKLKSMSLDELKQYNNVVKVLNGGINFLGIIIILFMLFNPTVGVLVGCGFILYFLASTGVNTVRFQNEIRKLIEAKDK